LELYCKSHEFLKLTALFWGEIQAPFEVLGIIGLEENPEILSADSQ